MHTGSKDIGREKGSTGFFGSWFLGQETGIEKGGREGILIFC